MTHGIDDEPPDGNEQDHANRELVERFFAASERGDLATLETLVDVLELERGRIRRATGYWGAPFPAQAARAPFVDHD